MKEYKSTITLWLLTFNVRFQEENMSSIMVFIYQSK